MILQYGTTLALALVVVAVSCAGKADRPAAANDQSEDHMTLIDFNERAIPKNSAGETYPSVYGGEGSVGTVGLNSRDAITGNSLQAIITSKGLYLQFNPYDNEKRGFARDHVSRPSIWRFNTYNRMSFWIKRPTSASPLDTGGRANVEFGTFVKRVANPDTRSDETGGNHYYHKLNLPNNGRWTQVILNMHPDHRRGESGGVDAGYLPHPTDEPRFNYFDALTRFYIDDTSLWRDRHVPDRRYRVLPGDRARERRPGLLDHRHP